MHQAQRIGFISLILLICVSIDSVRNLPSTALFGAPLVFLYLISAVFMLIPGSIAASEFAHAWPERGGIFHWVRLGLGGRLGFLAVWGQWINTLVWLPTILSFVAGSLAYMIKPSLADDPHYLALSTLVLFWGLTALSFFGFRISGRIASFCSFFGLLLPMGFIIVLAIAWLVMGKPSHVYFGGSHWLPNFHSKDDWFSLVAIMTSFEGFELVAVHMKDIHNPKKNYPRAMMISVVIILFTMVMGSLAIAMIVPKDNIMLVSGVAQGFDNFMAAYHIKHLLPVLIILMTLGNFGEMINWMSAPARGLYQASEYGYLPELLHERNRFGAERNLLILQGVIVSFVCLIFLFMPNVNGAYWFLTNLSVEIYMVVYLLLFVSAIIVEYKFPTKERLYALLQHRPVLVFIYALGVIGCIVTLIIGAFPPTNINIGSPEKYQLHFWLGIMICLLPIVPFYFYQRNKSKQLGFEPVITE
jgi:amino acid transporter